MDALRRAQAEIGLSAAVDNRPATVREQLQVRADTLKKHSDMAQEALEILDNNSDLERLLNIMREVGVY